MSDIKLTEVRIDGGTQMRADLSQGTISSYAEHIQDGAEFPPVVVFYDGSEYWLADGFHRYRAHDQAGLDAISADVRSGERIDAIRFALKANATNGRPRTSDDMRRAYQVAVDNRLCKAHDTNEVKELLRCSAQWARRLTESARESFKAERNHKITELSEQGKSQREIAEELDIASPQTVSNVLSVQKRNSFENGQEEPVAPEAEHEFPTTEPIEPHHPEDKHVHVSANSGNNEWYTPEEIIEKARSVMGGIDTDPASSEVANRSVKAETIYTEEDDGRDKAWHGNVWMNPPYAQPLIGDFCEAVSAKYDAGEIEQACVLVNNATETRWFQRMLRSCSAIHFPLARIRFIDMSGNPSGAPLQGQAILYFGHDIDKFRGEFGVVLTCE